MKTIEDIIRRNTPIQDVIIDHNNIVSVFISGKWFDYVGTSHQDGTHYVTKVMSSLAFRCGAHQQAQSVQRQLIDQGFEIAVFEEN